MAITFQGRWRLHGRGTKERNIGTKHRGPEIMVRDRGIKGLGNGRYSCRLCLRGRFGEARLWRSLLSRWRLVKIVPLTVGNGLGWAGQG
jgi:hypothetical protein